MAKVLVVYFSHFGHTEKLALAVLDGALLVEGVQADIKRVRPLEPHVSPDPTLCDLEIPLASAQELANYDAIIFGTPSRFGNMCADMMFFIEESFQHWANGALVGKLGAVFVSSSSQHGGHETAATALLNTLLHQGMIVTGLPYSAPGVRNMAEISGTMPYGAGVIAGGDNMRQPSDLEFEAAIAQGRHVASIARQMFG